MSDSMESEAAGGGGRVGEAMRRLEAAIGRVEEQGREVERLRAALAESESEKQDLERLLSETGTKLDSLIERLEGQLSGAGRTA